MNRDFSVHIEYKNRYGEKVGHQDMSLEEYTKFVYYELKHVIDDLENMIGRIEDTPNKQAWSEENQNDFKSMRKKLLDIGNGVQRLPQTLHYKGVPCCNVPLSEIIAQMANNAK